MTDWLPKKIYLKDYSDDWKLFIEAVYEIFKKDFIHTKSLFRGKRINLKRYPERNGMSATFWHMTTVGEVECERKHELERCQRIPWPKPIIDNYKDPVLKVWAEPRGSNQRIHIWFEAEGYLVVLEERKDYILPWTAFYVEKEHQRKKYNKRLDRYGPLP